MKHLLFRLGQLTRWTSDDGLGHFERKRLAERYRASMMAPLSESERAAVRSLMAPPSQASRDALKRWRKEKRGNNEGH
ncbi:hypothetical protein SEA_CECE_159 [Microbacterium phage Cece]|nr:hypothetical protein SEA_CECE_159 [Microbacterium phage Cece]